MGKRKSDTLDSELIAPSIAVLTDSKKEAVNVGPLAKKSRVSSEAKEAASGSKAVPARKPMTWQDLTLEGEDEDAAPIYDDCNEIRRKIRILQKTPGWKVTHWLRDIGGINSNSLSRFMKDPLSLFGLLLALEDPYFFKVQVSVST